MKESELQARILRELNDVPGCKAIPVNPGNGPEVGTPDIIGCYSSAGGLRPGDPEFSNPRAFGQAFLIEVKIGNEKPTKIQKRRMAEWGFAGATLAVAYEDFDVEQFLLGI